MNKKEYEKAKEAVISQFGVPAYELNMPSNESAKRLAELKQGYLKSLEEAKKTKLLAKKIDKLEPNDITGAYYPDELLRPEWLASFTDVQKQIIRQYMTNIDQTAQQIAEALGCSVASVNALKSLEAFKMLKVYLNKAFKDMLPFPALFKLKQLLGSGNESVAKDVAKMILMDAGLFKPDVTEQIIKTDKPVLDKDLQEKYKLLGDQILGIDSGTDKQELGARIENEGQTDAK